MTKYPAILLFDVPEPRRTQIIDAAIALGLMITIRVDSTAGVGGGIFEVEVPTPQAAYEFGLQCMRNGLAQEQR